MKWISIKLFVCLCVLSGAAAFLGAGFSYRSVLTPRDSQGAFTGIYGDGWLVDGAQMRFSRLAWRGNRLEMDFNPWRPAGSAAANLRVRVCDSVVAEFQVTGAKQAIGLKGNCDPRNVQFEVLNPVVASARDSRRLGALLKSVRVTSRFGLPLLDPLYLGGLAAAVLLLSLLVCRALAPGRIVWLSGAVPVAAFLLLKGQGGLEYRNVYYVWLLLVSILAGVAVARMIFRRRPAVPGGSEGAGAEDLAEGRARQIGLATAGLVVFVLAAGAGLRFYSLNFGLPNNYHPDEVPKVNAIMRMVQHDDLNPRYFLHPSFLLYSTYFTNKVFHLFGMQGTFRETAFLAGRTVSAIAGTFSILLLFLIGRLLYSSQVGLLSAAMLALMPLHVTCSRYLKEDSLLLFWILMCAWLGLKAVRSERRRYLLLAGLAGGLAASTKYSGALCVVLIGSLPWIKSRSLLPDWRWFWTAAAGLALVPIGFLAGSPYVVLDSAHFLKDFGSEQHHMTRGHTVSIDAWSQLWMYHFSRSIIPGMGFFSSLAAAAGIGVLLWRRRVEDLYVVGLILLFYLPAEWVKAKPAPQPERYIFPCLPFLAIAASELMRIVYASRQRWLVPLCVLALLIIPARRTLNLAGEIRDDTRTQLAEWMKGNLPHGSKLYLDWRPYSPRFWNNEFNVDYILRARIIPRLDIRALKASGYDYLVLSSLFYGRYFTEPKSDPAIRQRFREVFARVPIVKQFAPEHGTYGFHNPVVTLFSLRQEDFARLEGELALKARGALDKTSNEMRASFRWK